MKLELTSWLRVSVTSNCPYPENWTGLDLDHLKKLTDAVPGFPIVLHGGSGIPDEQIQEAIRLGVAKVNVNTESQIAFSNATRAFSRAYDADEAGYDAKLKTLRPT